MPLFRYTRDVYGQEMLAGVSWDLLPWFVGAAVAFIALHAALMLLRRPGKGANR